MTKHQKSLFSIKFFLYFIFSSNFLLVQLQSRTKNYETLKDFSIGSIRHKQSGF